MSLVEKWLDNLLHLPDIGERLCMGIARMRPELYIAEREQLALEPVQPGKPVKPVSLGGVGSNG